MKIFKNAVLSFFAFTIITGILYTFIIYVVGELCFPSKTEGSIVSMDGKSVGSVLIGQKFESAGYFHSRPSAGDYETIPSSASNYSVTSDTLKKLVQSRKDNFEADLRKNEKIPSEMLFASGSGLDPHISPEAAYQQVNRIIAARNLSKSEFDYLREMINKSIEKKQFGIFGNDIVNVLMLNIKLDERYGNRAE